MLSNHYADCIGPCQLACPAGVDIQGYIALAALGKYRDAIRSSRRRNPLPAVCGRVCTRPCEVKGCRRNLLDEAVGIDYIKRYLADLDLGEAEPFRPERRAAQRQAGRRGRRRARPASPAPTTSPSAATRSHIFESLPEAGGMLRYGIPEYRLPKEVLDLEINQILDLGVQLSHQRRAGPDFTVAEPEGGGLRRRLPRASAPGRAPRCGSQDEEAAGGAAGHRVPEGLRPAPGRPTRRPGAGGRRRQHRHRLRAHRAAARAPTRSACSTAAPATRCRPTRWRSTRPSTRA